MLSEFSIKRPYTVIVAVTIVLILGAISFINLQTDLLPNIDLPYLVISTTYPGASPEEVEMVVTRPIEQIVATTSNIKNVNSISSENSSLVILEFNNDVNLDSAIIEINNNLDLVKGAWDDSISSPMLIRLNPDMLPVMISSVDVEGMEINEISELVRNEILPELEGINGVASVTEIGILEEKIEVVLDQEKIDELNNKILDKVDSELLTAEQELLKAQKEIEDGKVKLDKEEKSQLGQLVKAERAIDMGRDQISEAQLQITLGISKLQENKELLQGAKEFIDGNEENLESLEKLREALAAIAVQLPEENKGPVENILEKLDEVLSTGESVNIGLSEIDDTIKTLEGQREELKNKKLELLDKEEEIKKGKALLSSEITKARIELTEGEKTLNEKLTELEEAKDEAFKQASLDGVLTREMISNILMAQNFSMPAGYIKEEGTDYLVKIGDKFDNIADIEKLLLFDTGEEAIGEIYLSDVAQVEERDNAGEIYAKVNGNNAIILNLQKQSNFSTSQVSKDINKKMKAIEAEHEGLTFTNLMDQGVYIDIVVDSVLSNIIYGGILAILVLIVFLKDIKPTFIIAVSIPISIVFAIAMMYFTGVTINIISLAGLALGVGMLVDNSIVVIENIYRLRNEGMGLVEAAVTGAKEVSGAILASTITTACVFLPIVFTKGISRQLFTDMGLTIAYSLFASLIVALTLVPVLGARVLDKTNSNQNKTLDKITKGYEKILAWGLKNRAIVMISVVVLLGISGYMAYMMGTSFIPEMESHEMSLSIELPEGSSFDEFKKLADRITEKIIDIEGIHTVGAMQGGMLGDMTMGNRGDQTLSMYLLLDEERSVGNDHIEKELISLGEDMGVEVFVNTSNMDMSQLGGTGIELLVKGREIDKLRDLALELEEIVKGTEGTTDVNTSIGEGTEEIRIRVDKDKAMAEGLTVAQIFSHVNSVLDQDKSATTLTIANKDYPVIVVNDKERSMAREDLKDMKITNDQGEEIKLGDLVSINEEKGLSSIYRASQERYITVNADIDIGYNIGLVSRDLERKIRDFELPEGYSIEFEGENKLIQDSLRDIGLMMVLAIALIYLIMVAQFQSLLSPFIVMFTIPLAFTGGFLALWLTGNNISLVAMLGFLVLSGVVVNNGIVFVDYANQLRERGMDKYEALIVTGKTRLRPILMTAITTILGLSTLSIGMGVGSEMLQPLAIVAIGGLLYATILTLLVVPVMYDLLHKEKTSTLD